jgi:hypothetical protein
VDEQKWREDERAIAYNAKQMAHHPSFLICDDHHIRLLAGNFPAYLEESAAVKEVGIIQLRQVLLFTVYSRRQLVHTAKIVKKYHKEPSINRD